MKTLNIPLEDKEYEALKENKKDLSWRDYILTLVKKKEVKKNDQ